MSWDGKALDMQDVAYIAFVLSFSVIGGLLGVGAHFWRAHATMFPEKIFDEGDIANEMFMDNYMFEKHAVGAEWDDSGYWSPDSVRNLVYYIISGFTAPILVGVAFWSDRASLVGMICSALTNMGLTPPLC